MEAPQLVALGRRRQELEEELERIGGLAEDLKKHVEPEVPIDHWGFLLKEMEWMATDFEDERKRKHVNSTKLSKAVHHTFQFMEQRRVAQAKRVVIQRYRKARHIAKLAAKFWDDVDRIAIFKHRQLLEAKHRAAMDKHLNFLVGQTERYTNLLAGDVRGKEQEQDDADDMDEDGDEAMESGPGTSALIEKIQPSGAAAGSAEGSAPAPDADDDDEGDEDFVMDKDHADVEDTIDEQEQHEAAGKDAEDDDDDSVSALQAEADMPMDQLIQRHGLVSRSGDSAPAASGVAALEAQDAGDQSSDESFHASEDEAGSVSVDSAELKDASDSGDDSDALAAEADMPVEALMAKYGYVAGKDVANGGPPADDSDDDDEDDDDSEVDSDDSDDISEEESESEDEEAIPPPSTRVTRSRGQVQESKAEPPSARVTRSRATPTSPQTMGDLAAGPDADGDDSSVSTPVTSEDEALSNASDATGSGDDSDALAQEADMPVDDLMRKYGLVANTSKQVPVSDSDDGDEAEDDSKSDSDVSMDQKAAPAPATNHVKWDLSGKDSRGRHAVPIPFLMPNGHRLREYQRDGLDWLVSMHERRLNGILADEMGLGKTIQTISLLAHLAGSRCIWGPHLVVVPTSTLLNWATEFKRWCPALKVVTYYGSAKERKAKRAGWSKPNAFHVVVTSYQVVVQDASVFRRKKWYYLILDEAHYIKNFESQRWQTLLTFATKRRLLLTGTPLQNSLMELWSLMHFLMPHLFRSQREFKYWFSNPLTSHVEGGAQVNQQLVRRLHSVLRPFVLRRLKTEVENQMPAKYEHILYCSMSKRQKFLYEDFMSRASTRSILLSGNYRSMLNVLMQLRKVCNHPDLFEPRLIASPFIMEDLVYHAPTIADQAVSGSMVDPLYPVRVKAPLETLSPRFLLLPSILLSGDGCSRVSSEYWLTRPVAQSNIVGIADHAFLTRFPQAAASVAPHAQFVHALTALHEAVSRQRQAWVATRLEIMAHINAERCGVQPMYGRDLLRAVRAQRPAARVLTDAQTGKVWSRYTNTLASMVLSWSQRLEMTMPIIMRCKAFIPSVAPATPQLELWAADQQVTQLTARHARLTADAVAQAKAHTHILDLSSRISFPDKRLLQWDCGKLQALAELLIERKKGGHRCLIFTQFSKMLDVLEAFLNLHGFTYFRLDGSTKVETRQNLMERFNRDDRTFVFILSTRSGGLGINLIGADTVVFYDTDWNPAMDAQAQDRAHRIGQTRDVHIYRLITRHTVEENILMKANQKRELNRLSLEEGNFTTNFLQSGDLRNIIGVDESMLANMEQQAAAEEESEMSSKAIAAAMADVEDDDDAAAGRRAAQEAASEMAEFEEREQSERKRAFVSGSDSASEAGSDDDSEDDDDEDEAPAKSKTPNDSDASSDASDDSDADSTARKSKKKKAKPRAKKAAADDDDDDDDDDASDDEGSKKRRRPKKTTKPPAAKVARTAGAEEADTGEEESEPEADAANSHDTIDRKLAEMWKGSDSTSTHVGTAEDKWNAIESQLRHVEKYALNYRQYIDPHPLVHPAVLAQAAAAFDAEETEWELSQLQRIKEEDEAALEADGELLTLAAGSGTEGSVAAGLAASRRLYYREVRRLQHEWRLRELSGIAWQVRVDALRQYPYYLNVDTQARIWDRPAVLVQQDEYNFALKKGFGALPNRVLHNLFQLLPAATGRSVAACVCRRWALASIHPGLFKWVGSRRSETSGHYASICDAVDASTPGETIIIEPGSYYDGGRSVLVERSVRIVVSYEQAHVANWSRLEAALAPPPVVDLNSLTAGGLSKRAATEAIKLVNSTYALNRRAYHAFSIGGDRSEQAVVRSAGAVTVFAGVLSARGLIITNVGNGDEPALLVLPGSRCQLVECTVSAPTNRSCCVEVRGGELALAYCSVMRGGASGVVLTEGAKAALLSTNIHNAARCGLFVICGIAAVDGCHVHDCGDAGICVMHGSALYMQRTKVANNRGGPYKLWTDQDCLQLAENQPEFVEEEDIGSEADVAMQKVALLQEGQPVKQLPLPDAGDDDDL